MVARAGGLRDDQLEKIAFGTFAYAAVFLLEGAGLLLRKQWAEWLTAIVTASFIPFEIWHAARHFSPGKLVTIAANVAIVVCLMTRIVRRRRER